MLLQNPIYETIGNFPEYHPFRWSTLTSGETECGRQFVQRG